MYAYTKQLSSENVNISSLIFKIIDEGDNAYRVSIPFNFYGTTLKLYKSISDTDFEFVEFYDISTYRPILEDFAIQIAASLSRFYDDIEDGSPENVSELTGEVLYAF